MRRWVATSNKAFIDIRLRPGVATPLGSRSPPNRTSSINRKYITYRNVKRTEARHRRSAQKISWILVKRFQRYARRQTDNLDRNTRLPYWGRVTNQTVAVKSQRRPTVISDSSGKHAKCKICSYTKFSYVLVISVILIPDNTSIRENDQRAIPAQINKSYGQN